ncbi:DUF3592 domain-containing protein [Simiduia sp. 21SJ11W-1]|uniref:DUF3592 domain-containing protein n=1 Tax=Simiduia sp. 21SJ11W-1 TaxID=2909669 RepID=UPI00209D0A12|nr:DUF3592 domain-containing protein [Simiduia sp. 21SJ11W-1]UTA48107.1 DUF3592 domain-containing protein [Simiduia sp. 21SJ11W-1]
MAPTKPKKTNTRGAWLLSLFALPFACVGVGFLLFSIIPSVVEWAQMQSWQPVSAEVLSANTRVSRGDDSTTYEAQARYRYVYQGGQYESARVGIMSGADNIGRWQQARGAELKRALQNKRAITVYVNPNEPQEAVVYRELRWGMLAFKSIFVVVFGGVGIGLIWLAWRKADEPASLEGEPEPWRLRKAWANPVHSNSKLGLYVITGFAIVWNALSLPVVFVVPEELAKGNQAILFALVFPLVGAGLIIAAIVKWRQWLRFGAVPLHMNPWPAQLGGQLAGKLAFALPYNPHARVELRLSCIHSYYSGTGKNRERREKIVWQAEGYANTEPAPVGSAVEFAFDIPADLPHSQLPDERYHFWRLDVSANIPGADFSQQYEVPVFATGEAPARRMACASAHPEMAALREQRLEKLLNARQIPEGIELFYGIGRRLVGRTIGLVIGAGMAVGGWMMGSSNAPIIFPIVLVGIGAIMALVCAYGLLNSYLVKVGTRGLYTERRLLGVVVAKGFIAPAEIKGLEIKSKGSSQVGTKHTEHFVIDALLNNKKRVRVVEDLDGRAMAEQALEAVSLLSGVRPL